MRQEISNVWLEAKKWSSHSQLEYERSLIVWHPSKCYFIQLSNQVLFRLTLPATPQRYQSTVIRKNDLEETEERQHACKTVLYITQLKGPVNVQICFLLRSGFVLLIYLSPVKHLTSPVAYCLSLWFVIVQVLIWMTAAKMAKKLQKPCHSVRRVSL